MISLRYDDRLTINGIHIYFIAYLCRIYCNLYNDDSFDWVQLAEFIL